MINKSNIVLVFVFLFGLHIGAQTIPTKAIDVSEKILRVNKLMNFDNRGFGLHDIGDKSFKIFDWNLNLLKKVPITNGEGPSEIKLFVSTAAWTNDGYLFLMGYNEYKINKFDPSGKYITTFKTAFRPFKIIERKGKLYLFNKGMEMSSNNEPFLQIIDSATGKILKTSKFKTVPDPKTPLSEFDPTHYNVLMDNKGIIYILCGSSPALYKITDDGKILKKTVMPFSDKKRKIQTNQGPVTEWVNLFDGMVIEDGVIYTLFVEYDYSENPKDKAHLVRVSVDGKSEVIRDLEGYYNLFGNNGNQVFLFERNEYFVLPIDISKPNK